MKCILYSIPPKTVHAIGAGMVIAEIQQNSNVTYRLCDYGRLGADGKSRPLHTEKGTGGVEPCTGRAGLELWRAFGAVSLLYGGFVAEDAEGCCDGSSFSALLVTAGEGELRYGDEKIKICSGECVFLPANTGDWRICGNATGAGMLSQR